MNLHEKMNKYLADQQVMYIKLHHLHWYIEGSSFFTLHSRLEVLYNQSADMIDTIGERMLALGVQPVASVRKAISLSTVEELDDGPIQAKEALHQLITDTEYWIQSTRDIVTAAEAHKDMVTADLFTGYLKEYEKNLWMLKAYAR